MLGSETENAGAASRVKEYRGKLVLYNLDSTLKLEQWHMINGLAKELMEYQGQSDIVECGIDLLLSSESCPTDTLVGALQIIVKDAVYSQNTNLAVSSKWVRIMMSLTLPTREQVCDEALGHLKEGLALRNVRRVQGIGDD